MFKKNHYDNGQIVLNDWTAVRVTVGYYKIDFFFLKNAVSVIFNKLI